MKTAFLFPGQGSQYPGMGHDLYEHYPEARALFDAADALLGIPLTEYMFGGEDTGAAAEALKQTEITQPALYVHSMAAALVLDAQLTRAEVAAGHSLGEYSALAASGAVSFEDGLRVVRLRGELMAEAGTRRPGAMAAVLGMDDDALEIVCLEASEASVSVVQAANFNAPGQIVISGDADAVERAGELARERGAKRVVPLPVSGAFHSPLMEYARDGLASALIRLNLHPPKRPVYLNVTAEPTTDPEKIREGLLEQLMAPVRWSQTLRNMQRDGVYRFLEVGAGSVLSGLVRRTLGRDADTSTAGKAEELQTLPGGTW